MNVTTELTTDQEALSKDKQLIPPAATEQAETEQKALMDYCESAVRAMGHSTESLVSREADRYF